MKHVAPRTVLVWFDHREFVRFGSPVNLNDIVDLTLGDDHVLSSPWEQAVGAPILLRAGRHAPGTDVRHVRVQVDRLWEAHAQLELDPCGGWRVSPHGGDIVPVDGMDFTTPEAISDADGLATPKTIITVFSGWIMQATVVAELPPREHGWPYGIEPLVDLTDIGSDAPRLFDWAPELDANPNATAEPSDGWTMRTPFFAAVQHDWCPSDSEFALGHPCIVESADTVCVIACYMSRKGMHHTLGVGATEHYVRLSADEFIERSRRLLDSPWSGFRNETQAENWNSPLDRWSEMFPHGIPRELRDVTPKPY
ncbi:hypothetical protein [Luteococcus sanguinis]|uniref:Uncharacterized protein n=1 Tax=Luteococcus sanguinis TaxID=174038 RepID=A0ABW1X0X4_9ACTN